MGKTQLHRQITSRRSRTSAVLFAACLALLGAPRAARAVSELDYGLEQHYLHRIEITGNTTFPDKELESILKIHEPRGFYPLMLLGLSDPSSRYQPHLLDAELKLISRYYQQRGFHQVAVALDSVVADPDDRGDDVYISVDEGPRTYLAAVSVAGVPADESAALLKGVRYREGVPAPSDLNDLGTDIYLLRTRLWETGHMRAVIRPVMETWATGDPERREARLTYHVREGLKYVVDGIDVRGLSLTRPEIVRRELTIRDGDLFRWSEIERSQRRLLETALFRDVGFQPVDIDTTAGTTGLQIDVVERKPAYYEFGFGVGTRERIRVLVTWGHNNLFGTGQRLRIRTRNALNYEDVQRLTNGPVHPELNFRYDVTHTYPGAFGRLRLETRLYLGKETRGESGLNLLTRGLAFGTRFAGGGHVSNDVEARVEVVDPSLHPDAKPQLRQAFESSDLRASHTRSLGWSLMDETRDDPLRPRGGTLKSLQLEIAGGPFGGDNSFGKVSASWHHYVKTALGGVLAMRVSVGAVRPYGGSLARGADGVPYQERFFAGGATTVRGYLERSLGPQITDQALRDSLRLASDVPLPNQPARGGNYLMLTNVEWRYPMPLFRIWGVHGVFFVDGGNVWEKARNIRLNSFRWRSYPRDPADPSATNLYDYRYSVGGGVRIGTPVGPVRLDVGFPLKRAKLTNPETHEVTVEDKVVYHFSLGYPF